MPKTPQQGGAHKGEGKNNFHKKWGSVDAIDHIHILTQQWGEGRSNDKMNGGRTVGELKNGGVYLGKAKTGGVYLS